MAENFVGKIQAQGRIAIPCVITEVLNLQKGDKVRIQIEKVR
jgi:bifunctional DNA-binding transcriptional regulator/antitoxin component of YhaV-PrlF toxin-antitoxin module